MKTRFLFACALLLLFFQTETMAQWSPFTTVNTPICVATGKQIDLRMESDGKGGAFVTWKDYRASVPDIYIQRVNSAGVPMWAFNGVPLCTDPYDQSTPSIVSDMNGGAIVAWSDWRSGIERDLYAQRVDSNGSVLWTYNGAIVSNKTEREHNERVVSDGAGGVIVVWEQQRLTDYTWDIWIQRLNSAGAPVWPNGGIPVVINNANRINPKMQIDGKGGVLLAWEDYRSGFDYDIYGQYIDANGTRLWGSAGKGICVYPGTQINPKVDPDSASGGIYVAWTDRRMGGLGYDLYAQRVDSNGNGMWTTNGVVVSDAPNSQSAPDILSNSHTNGLFLTWKDKRSGEFDIYAQKLNEAGIPQWTPNGIPICTAPTAQVNPNVASDNLGGAIIVWQDSSGSGWDVRSQRIDVNGNLVWTPNGEWVCTAINDQTSPKNISDGNGGSIFAWQDKRSGTNDIYVHHLFADGLPIVSTGHPIASAGLSGWPNPFAATLFVDWDGDIAEVSALRILDIAGKCLGEVSLEDLQSAGGGRLALAAQDYFPACGVYLLQLETATQVHTLKVVRTGE